MTGLQITHINVVADILERTNRLKFFIQKIEEHQLLETLK